MERIISALTLSISPHKNAGKLMEIGEKLAKEYNISYLPSDFKKKNGYKRSIELSKEYNLYRQNYCGCVFSRQQAEKEGRNTVKNQNKHKRIWTLRWSYLCASQRSG